jgi:hypothetical protein
VTPERDEAFDGSTTPEHLSIGHAIVNRIRSVTNHELGTFTPVDEETDVFQLLYLTQRDTCVPEELLSDDLLLAIREMYVTILDGIREELRARVRADASAWILVDPSYEDTTSFALITEEHVLLSGWRKAWNFYWDSEDSMAEELDGWYHVAAARLSRSPSNEEVAADGRYVVTLELERKLRVDAEDPGEARELAISWTDNESDPATQLLHEEVVTSRVEPASDDDH